MTPNGGQPAHLRDVINYEPETYFSPEELSLIRNTFKNNKLLKVLRKTMIPSIADPELPIESFGDDTFLQNRQWASIPADEAKILIVAREEAIKFICGALIKLQVIANVKEETKAEVEARRTKDSSK